MDIIIAAEIRTKRTNDCRFISEFFENDVEKLKNTLNVYGIFFHRGKQGARSNNSSNKNPGNKRIVKQIELGWHSLVRMRYPSTNGNKQEYNMSRTKKKQGSVSTGCVFLNKFLLLLMMMMIMSLFVL